MKEKYLLLAILALCNYLPAETAYKLADAVKQGIVTVEMTGARPDSTEDFLAGHLGPCMEMEVVNNNSYPITLTLDYGYRLVPDDSNVQTMMVTRMVIFKIEPKKKKLQRMYAMCTEATDAGPSSLMHFKIGNRANGNLLGLAALINQKNYQTDAAQSAVWCLTNNHDLQSIYSDDTTMMYDLRRFVARAKAIPLALVYADDVPQTYTPAEQVYTTRTVYSGSLTYSLGRTQKILVALFDNNDHMKRIYVNNETQHEGEYTYHYQIGSDEMGNGKHYLRLYRDGKIDEEIAIIPHD